MQTLPAIIAITCYLIATVLQWQNVSGRTINHLIVRLIGLIAVISHGYASYLDLHRPSGIHLEFFSAGSLIGWLVAGLVLLSSLRQKIDNLFIGIFPLAAITLFFTLFGLDDSIGRHYDAGLIIHILISILAYSIFTLAAFQAVLLAKQEYQLKHHKTKGLLRSLPPLQTMEALLFEMIWTGLILLTLSLITGAIVFDDLFAQHLVHKTILSIFAWLLYASLLVGRHLLGWRSHKAIRWTVGGFIVLMLSFFGSKFVVEQLL
ncbi:cytochrome c biogenesis protein CcsA [Amphritea sp. 1_MG-2023]|uniref:cytochrome C assembly family protein n=1 Tax=Amphritea sp. 1_MG-2023 TaxID=3062670 RepID=UPI0026E1C9DD|nr:cytochrome c biogenesis protein CcsA [Amphritea sp. 1_MG-2023]MDO6563242.1 cytochrome c biogenesis protein CcsA [Amphritea sp. 1_MG-2023]